MWRFCDLHRHTVPNEQCGDAWDPARFIHACNEARLDVVAVTDHDHCDRVAETVEAAEREPLVVIPGVELSTDRGHILVIAPGEGGVELVRDFTTRVGAAPQRQVELEDVLDAVRSVRGDGSPYDQSLVLVGAHVDMPGSLLASGSSLSLEAQLKLASRLHALEVSNDATLADWARNGVKQGPRLTLLRGSDMHTPAASRQRGTWLYLPEITAESLRHALAIPEASVCLDTPPTPPSYVIESISFSGGHHDGLEFRFCERANALIGPPNSGKSLIVDALKFAFGSESDLDAVEQVLRSRMAHCMPDGSTVEVRVRTPEGIVKIARKTGGENPPSPPFRPIIFGQTELTRRAIAATPSISLLDLHCPQAHQLQAEIDEARADVAESFAALLTDARKAASLRSVVSNPHDGLDASRNELDDLTGTERVAKRAVSTAAVAGWRQRTRASIETWQTTCEVAAPPLPQLPGGVKGTDLETFTPRSELDAISTSFLESVATAARRTAEQMMNLLDANRADFVALKNEVDQQLADAGFDAGSEVQKRLDELRGQVEQLEQRAQELDDLEQKIETDLRALRSKHRKVHEKRQELTRARRQSCKRVNQSMRTFFAMIDPDGGNDDLDTLIEELKTGTWLRAGSRKTVRDSLERFRLLERAVRLSQGLVDGQGDSESSQDKIVTEALDRGKAAEIARLACTWPDDALVLAQRTKPPTPFPELTEGLRALAIKEISFATSGLPVVSDQPEDAVPTRSVFESLVPALREQRSRRQFIVVSHDANIVVAGDVERILALQENHNSPHSGSLFDPRIRNAAMEHLEGGLRAFQLRRDRYAQLG